MAGCKLWDIVWCLLMFSPEIQGWGNYRWGYNYYNYLPTIEYEEHDPDRYTTPYSKTIPGATATVPLWRVTPDFRLEEAPLYRYRVGFNNEENRPYRVSPHFKQVYHFRRRDNVHMVGCACTTVWKRYHLLAGCALITTRHVLTSATATELIWRQRRKWRHFQNYLGFWYDVNMNIYNSSYYATPAAFYIHPQYMRPENVNRSHPFPTIFDIAVWATTYRVYRHWLLFSHAIICDRAQSNSLGWALTVCNFLFSRRGYAPTVPTPNELALIVGFQFIRAYRRKPLMAFKYMVRTRNHVVPCPKTEWGSYYCIRGNWAKLGMDVGAAMFRALEGRSIHYDGLTSMCVLTMRLRSLDLIHYFQVLDRHSILDFFYNVYNNFIPYDWLDTRFEIVKGRAPVAKQKVELYHEFRNEYLFSNRNYLPNY